MFGQPHGIMLGDGLACWDLDDILDEAGNLSVDAQAKLDEIGDRTLWIERSQSGRGLHVFVHGAGSSRQTKNISYYSHSRFIAMTGDEYRR